MLLRPSRRRLAAPPPRLRFTVPSSLASAIRANLGVSPLAPPRVPELPDALEIDPYTSPQVRIDLLQEYVWHGAADTAVGEAALAIVLEAVRSGVVRYGDLTGYVQVIADWQGRLVPYVSDPSYPDGWQMDIYQTPGYTLRRRKKDCEDGATFISAACWWLGMYSEVDWLAQENADNTHVASRVCLTWGFRAARAGAYPVALVRPRNAPPCVAGRLVWIESTLPELTAPAGRVPGAQVGEHPYDALERQRRAAGPAHGVVLARPDLAA